MFMKRAISLIIFTLLSQSTLGAKYMGVETPSCWGQPIKSKDDVKCIAFFLGKFSSTLNPHGDVWDVKIVNRNEVWFVYPKVPSEQIPEGTVLYKIDGKSGKPFVSY